MNGPNQLLLAQLQKVASRRRRLQLWLQLAIGWAAVALLGLTLSWLQNQTGWASSLTVFVVVFSGLAAAFLISFRHGRTKPDWHKLAAQIEAGHPELDGRLLTAVQQQPGTGNELNYLQDRVVRETLLHNQQHDWAAAVPKSRITLAWVAHLVSLIFFAFVLWGLRTTGGHSLLARISDSKISVTPGDINLERGNSLVVLARFDGPLPPVVELVIGPSYEKVQAGSLKGGRQTRIPLVKSLADPMFGGSVPEVLSNLVYHIEYGGQRTRDYKASVFEYPRLERADATLTYPDYTGQPPKTIEDTRRLSAVEGSRVDLTLQLNKPVASAQLVAKEKDRTSILMLQAHTNRAIASLSGLLLQTSKTYELQLVDTEGRTNKGPVNFVFNVLKNRTPELRLASPRGDVRPSPLEEISFEGTVWDDFGVKAYGLGYTQVGGETKTIELGKTVPANEKRSFKHVLRLEDLGVQADQLLAWFIWADDTGPDGQLRRTSGDLFFAEVRPFEEVFREGQGMDGGQSGQGQGGQQGGQTGKLTELQKQIISATWKLQREHTENKTPAPSQPKKPTTKPEAPAPQDSEKSSSRPTSSQRHISPLKLAARLDTIPPLPQGEGRGEGEQEVKKPARRNPSSIKSGSGATPSYQDDAVVVRDSQGQALDQAEAAARRQDDPRAAALWAAAIKEMEKALTQLNQATNSAGSLPEALAAEQAAYQALLKLQQHEYQVARNRNRNQQGGGGRDQQMQRQLEQMELTQSENRYETQRQAQRPQTTERREQLQVMNRLQELAKRQQDLNERLKELQTALQEARSEQEREEIRRRLKRLQEEEQQMLADMDEVRQRMDRPENQSRMADERKQLEETREDVQRAAEAASQGAASQALASGTRAQRQLQQVRDQLRKESSSQFADELREMRAEARELDAQQEDILNKMQAENNRERKTLSDSSERKQVSDQLDRQQQRMTNLVERATQVSQQAEDAEPLLSRQLYDTVRKFSQDTAKNLQETRDDLLRRGMMPRSIYEQLKDPDVSAGAKLLELSSEMWRQDFRPQASEAARRARQGTADLKRGVERAAESVLGDDTEALRLAQQQLDQLTDALQREFSQINTNEGRTSGLSPTNRARASTNSQSSSDLAQAKSSQGKNQAANRDFRSQNRENASAANNEGESQAGSSSAQDGKSGPPSEAPLTKGGERSASSEGNAGQAQASSAERSGSRADNSAQRGTRSPNASGNRTGQEQANAGSSGNLDNNFEQLLNAEAPWQTGPITGEGYGGWSDRLRDVEEMIEFPDLRNRVAVARDRARLLRQEYKRDLKKPDWAVVRLQIINPLAEVRDRIADELARRQSSDALVPIDRDPVPNRYSDLVRRYYEGLGKDR